MKTILRAIPAEVALMQFADCPRVALCKARRQPIERISVVAKENAA